MQGGRESSITLLETTSLDLAQELRALADVPTYDRKAIFQRMAR